MFSKNYRHFRINNNINYGLILAEHECTGNTIGLQFV